MRERGVERWRQGLGLVEQRVVQLARGEVAYDIYPMVG